MNVAVYKALLVSGRVADLFQMVACIYSLKKMLETEFHIFLRDIVKYLKPFDSKQESKHIIYLHTNNLYGYAMSKFLPASGLKWIDAKEFDLNKYTSSSSEGFVLEVDLGYPKESCKLHNDYCLAPDKIEFTKQMSNYQLKIADF